MDPAVSLISFDGYPEARYERIFRGYESAILIWEREGAGGWFLTIQILIWARDDYIVLSEKVDYFYDANFALGDLDGDGWKELIVKHGCRAIPEFKLRN